jgi:nitrogen fixation protein NifB
LSKPRLRVAEKKAGRYRPTQAAKADSPKVLVAVATKGGGLVNQHFGHAKEFMIYEVDAAEAKFIGHRKVADYCQGGYGEEAALTGIISTIADCQAVLAAKVGPCPQKELQKAGLQVIEAYDVIETVARHFYDEHVLSA